MPLDQVDVEGYQSLKDARLRLGRFTVIVGESNVGKSALLRAIQGAVENEAGTGFIHHGMKAASITLRTRDGAVVRWTKPKTGSPTYDLNGKLYTKIGNSTVPEDVSNALRMRQIGCGAGIKLNIHFHSQWSLPFLADESSPRVAKILGELSGVNLLYLATQDANAKAKKAGIQVTALGNQVDSLKTQILTLGYLKKWEPILIKVRDSIAAVKGKAERLKQGRDLLQRLQTSEAAVKDLDSKVRQLSPVSGVDLEPLNMAIDKMKTLEKLIKDISKAEKNVEAWTAQVASAEQSLKAATTQKEALEVELKVCPLCEKPFDEEHKCQQ
jgi:energy-coupling factor transporter ATP-binding protein EcfA2